MLRVWKLQSFGGFSGKSFFNWLIDDLSYHQFLPASMIRKVKLYSKDTSCKGEGLTLVYIEFYVSYQKKKKKKKEARKETHMQ